MPKNFERVASELKENDIPVISPNLKDLKLSDNVFQSMPSSDLLQEKIVNYVKLDSTKNHVIIRTEARRVGAEGCGAW